CARSGYSTWGSFDYW
nr:immunoglobulin heavy chain junction region [Macaca mulatta]